MNIEQISVGPYEVNCAIIWGSEKQALVLDPGMNAKNIKKVINENNLQVAAYLITHGHADHIHALAELHTALPAPIYMHPADQKWAFGPNTEIPPFYGVPDKPDADFPAFGKGELSFSNPWKIADLSFQTLETPGHTPGCVCYWFENNNICFTGDTLFKGSAGRTDLPGGDSRILSDSLKKLAATLPPETKLIPGHHDSTTMQHELATNFFLQRFQP